MPYGLSAFQLGSILAPVVGAGITALVYLFSYNKQENSRIASEAEEERWEKVKRKYGKMISNHHTEIQNSPNTFISLSDPDDSAETISGFVEGTHDFEELGNAITEMQRPQWYHKWCRRGAEYAPWTFFASAVILIISTFSDSSMRTLSLIIGLIAFCLAVLLTIVFLYFRAKMNGVADEVQFRV
jgi:hypothetical protein